MSERNIRKIQHYIFRAFLMTVLLMIASSLGYLFRLIGFPETNIVIVYLLAVLMTAWLTRGFIFGILASVIATFAFNYFFTEPYFTFSVNDPSYIITFVIMTITAIITSTLTSHVKQSALSAREKEAETKAVYNLTSRLTDAKDMHDIAGIAVNTISDCFLCKAAILCFDENGMPEISFLQQVSSGKQIHRKAEDTIELKHRIEGLRTSYDTGAEFYDWPIYGRESILGIIRMPKERAQVMSEAQIRILHSMIESVAMAMDRFRSSEQRIKAREEAVQERYRSTLLQAISHDLRTPLSGIMGTSEMLMDMTKTDDPRYSLVEGIYEDADWLHALVENILNLTRLQEGKLVLDKQMEAVEEVIGSAVERIALRSPKHEITVSAPDELLLVPMDAKLIEQVLVNLLDNAVKHTSPEGEISVSVAKSEKIHSAVFAVRDRGSGIAADDLPHVFEMFYTSHVKRVDAKNGIGLGLAICDAIIKAHGGAIEARNRTDGQGAEFVFTLPLEVENNE
ncbi:MAG: integral rane sensor signal transduction histidine kinase [Clostridia bacterium]|nr:integral rane sensor signal transduction histidine kinase [Clostridia bacterium]